MELDKVFEKLNKKTKIYCCFEKKIIKRKYRSINTFISVKFKNEINLENEETLYQIIQQ
jgi:hypothetical protein